MRSRCCTVAVVSPPAATFFGGRCGTDPPNGNGGGRGLGLEGEGEGEGEGDVAREEAGIGRPRKRRETTTRSDDDDEGGAPGALRRLRRLGRRLSSGRRSAPPSDDGVDSFRPEARGKMRYRSFLDRPEPPEESLSSIQHLQRILPIGISDIISGGIRQRKVLDESPDWTGPHDGARLERERRVKD